MNDIEKRNDIPSASNLSRYGISAIICGAGGALLFILQIISRFRVIGLLVGVVMCILGVISLKSKDPADTKPGAVITAAGVLIVLSKTGIPLLQAVSGTLLSIGAFSLIAMGIWNALKFFIGLKKRS